MATFQLGTDKAPGPDGFSMAFFQRFWEVIKDDLLKIFRDLFAGVLDSGPLDYAHICLVPKKEGAKTANDFRPICLINCVQKIISKVLANRLEKVMHSIISTSQTAFLKGRLILDAFVTANEIISWCSKEKAECVGIKADFEKTFDRVNWGFLRKMLFWLGANHKWIGWIDQCIANAKVAILVNGVPTKWIKLQRGLRQGDPLSPLLYLIVAEGMTRLIDRAVSNNLLCGVGPTEEGKIAIIQFADDTIFFCKAKARQIRNLRYVWQLFEWASGLKINRNKSELFYLGSREHKGEELAEMIGCKVGRLPIKYLGLPLANCRMRKEDWWCIISKIEKRIEGWQAKLLSQGGRLTLVNSVLENLPLYYFSVFLAPKWVIRRIEALRRAFFWKGGTIIKGGQCLVSWKTVCRDRKDGGLGVKDLENMNLALLVKWWWRFFSSSPTLWGPLIERLYYKRRRPLYEGISFKPYSQWWRNVLGTRDLFKCSTTHSVGNGSITSFWSDNWLGGCSLQTQFPHIFGGVRSKKFRVKECFGNNEWNWRKILWGFTTGSQSEEGGIESLKQTLAGVQLNECIDQLKWRWSTSEVFSVKSMYDFLQDSGVADKRFEHLWKLKLPLKVKIFVWLVLKKRVLTSDRLLKRGWIGSGLCIFCLGELETVDHLFVGCATAQTLLWSLLTYKAGLTSSPSTGKLWVTSEQKVGSIGRKDSITIAATWWTLWLERNSRRFGNNKKRGIRTLYSDIRALISLWSACWG